MSLKQGITEETDETIERVCRAVGCNNRFFAKPSGRGGRTRQYCDNNCKVSGSRNGRAGSALEKAQELEAKIQSANKRAMRLMEQAKEEMRQADLLIVVKGVAMCESEYDRLQAYLVKVEG